MMAGNMAEGGQACAILGPRTLRQESAPPLVERQRAPPRTSSTQSCSETLSAHGARHQARPAFSKGRSHGIRVGCSRAKPRAALDAAAAARLHLKSKRGSSGARE